MANVTNNKVYMPVFTGLCVALCVVLPMAFHMIPNAGQVICPMHIPVLICGLVCGWQYGLLCGLLGPLLSSLLTGMPPTAILPSMMVELAVYGVVCSLMMKLVKTRRLYADLYISLVTAMIAGRVISGVVKALFFAKGQITLAAWATASFVTCLPGIIIHLALIPTLIFALQKAGVAPLRYTKKAKVAVDE